MQDSFSQTSSGLSNNTPRETKQRKLIPSQRQKIRRLQASSPEKAHKSREEGENNTGRT